MTNQSTFASTVLTPVKQTELREEFEANGFVKIDQAFSGEHLSQIQQEVDQMIDRSIKSGRQLEAHWRGEWREDVDVEGDKQARSVLSIHNIQYHSACLAQLMFHPNLVDPAAAVIGTTDLQLSNTLMHAKPPKIGAAFPMHQDYDYAPHKLDTLIAVTLYLDDSGIDNGCLCVYPGSHKQGYIEKHEHQGSHHLPMNEYPIDQATPVPMKAGDLLIFSYLTVHGSTPNTSDQWRRMLLFSLRSPLDNRKSEPEGSVGQGLIVRGVHPNPVPKSEESY